VSAPVKVGDVVAARCSCGETFHAPVSHVYDYGPGGSSLAFLTHGRADGGCGSTRCLTVCRRCNVRVEDELELCRACSDEAAIEIARSA